MAELPAERVEEWGSLTNLSVEESIDWMLQQQEKTAKDHSPTWLQELQERWKELLEKAKAKIDELGAWLSENRDRVVGNIALGVGVAGVSLGVVGQGPEIRQEVQQFFQDTVAIVQDLGHVGPWLQEKVADFHEVVGRIEASAKELLGEISFEFSPSSQGAIAYYSPKVDPSYEERANSVGDPEPW